MLHISYSEQLLHTLSSISAHYIIGCRWWIDVTHTVTQLLRQTWVFLHDCTFHLTSSMSTAVSLVIDERGGSSAAENGCTNVQSCVQSTLTLLLWWVCWVSKIHTYVTLSTISLLDGDGCGCRRCLKLWERETGMVRNPPTKKVNCSAIYTNSRRMCTLSYTCTSACTKKGGAMYTMLQ